VYLFIFDKFTLSNKMRNTGLRRLTKLVGGNGFMRIAWYRTYIYTFTCRNRWYNLNI